MADMVTIMQTMRRNPGFIPDWAWYRDGEEGAVIGSENMGNIEISTYKNEHAGDLRSFKKQAIKESRREWIYKYR